MNEIINRLKELLAKATDVTEADREAHVAVWLALPALLSTLTNLTPSEGMERITIFLARELAEAQRRMEEKVGDYGKWLKENHGAELLEALLLRVALPSEPPSQADVEGRARELLAAEFEAPSQGSGKVGLGNGRVGYVPKDAALRAIVAALATKEDGRS